MHYDDDALIDEIIDALGDADVWEAEPAPPPRQLVFDVVAFAQRAKEEDRLAHIQCDEILTGPASWWPQRLAKADGGYTAGMVKELLERMRTMLERSPANALQLTTMAIDVAHRIDVAEYPCDYVVKLRAQAYRDHAYVLSFMGRYPEALEYTDRAKRLFDQVPLPEYDLARLALVRASILRAIDRVAEAIELARGAAETFLRYGDATRHAHARIWEANAIYETGAVDDALRIWKSLEHDPVIDAGTRVQLIYNMALAFRQTNQLDVAATYLQRCAEEYAFLGMDAHRTRSRATVGEILIAAGRPAEAVPIFRQAWSEFDSMDMIADGAISALQLAEAMLLSGETADVAAICRTLIARFTAAGMTSRAITALSFLREAVAIGQATPSLVRHVHEFLRELPAERPRLYAPAPPGPTGD